MKTSQWQKPDPEYQKFLCRYHHDGSWWSLVIHAKNWVDADAICKKHSLQLDGEYMGEIPEKAGVLARFICWLKNQMRSDTATGY